MQERPPKSEYILFGDESGDHGLANLHPRSRAFVIAFAIVRRRDYEQVVIPRFRRFKRRYLGDESVPLHEREIRRGEGVFRRLHGPEKRLEAQRMLRQLVQNLPFNIISVGFRKDQFAPNPELAGSPYDRRFVEGLAAYAAAMPGTSADTRITQIVVDARGAKEDARLQNLVESLTLATAGETANVRFQIRFAKKFEAEVGVELADLIASPIAWRILGRAHPLIPFELLEPKFLRHPSDPDRISMIVLDGE